MAGGKHNSDPRRLHPGEDNGKETGVTDRELLAKELTALIQPVLADAGVELVEMQVAGVRRPIVRAFIDKIGGVTIAECTAISKRFSLELDAADIITGSYTLEVSSPGLDRPLTTPADFNRKRGEIVSVRRKSQARPVSGTIVEAGEQLTVETTDGRQVIDFADIIDGRLQI